MEQLAALRPDIIGFQEIDLGIDQGNWICGRLNDLLGTSAAAPEYRIHHMANPRENVSLEALGIMTRLPVVAHTGFDYLIRNRVTHCVRIEVGGRTLDFWNTHVHHEQDKAGNEMRCEQADKLTAWIASHSQGVPVVAVGDFNCIPQNRPLRTIAAHLTSVFDRLGVDAPPTAPTPLEVPPRYPGVWPVDNIFVSKGRTRSRRQPRVRST